MDKNLHRFINIGIRAFGDQSVFDSSEKTILVIGGGRDGISLLSGALHHLGIFTGHGSLPPVFEDTVLASAIDSGDFESARKIIEEYNMLHNIWAFKRPSLIHKLKKMHTFWRNPVYLFVFKDIAAIANRNVLSMGMDFKQSLFDAHTRYGIIINFLQTVHNINGLALSYEKIIRNKEATVNTLVKLTGKNPHDIDILKALEFIKPNSGEYLDKSRIVD